MSCAFEKVRARLNSRFRNDAVIVLVLIAIVVVFWLPRLNGPIDLRWDGGIYYILGTSLAEGKGYRLLNEPGDIEAVQYPPLLPLIVATHQWVLGTSDILVVGPWLRVFYFFVSVSLTISMYWLARLYLSPLYAMLATLVFALCQSTHYMSDMLYTEVPFALVTTLFAILNRKSKRVGYVISTGVMGVAAYLLRTAGIALLAAWVVESLLQGRFKQMAMRAAVALVPVLVWQAHIAQVKDSEQYRQPVYAYQRAPYQYSNVTYIENMLLIKPFTPELGQAAAVDISRRIATNLITLPTALGEVVSALIESWRWPLKLVNSWINSAVLPLWPVIIPILLLGCLVVAGMVLLAVQREWFVPLYFGASVGLLCLTPFPEQFATRYLTPLTPFLALSLSYTLSFIGDWHSRRNSGRWKKASSVFIVLVVMMIFFVEGFSLVGEYSRRKYPVNYYDVSGNEVVYHLFSYDQSWRALDMSLELLRQQASPGDVIATTAPHWAYLRTGLKSVLPPMVANSKQAQQLLDSVPVKYVVVDDWDYPNISKRYAAPVVKKNPNLWKCIYVAPGGQALVYERVQ